MPKQHHTAAVAQKARAAFTLVELLIVIGIIGVLLSILLPVVGGTRRQVKSMQCQSNERQLFTACVAYAADHSGALPIPSILGETSADPAVVANCCWPLDRSGVANLKVGALWKYVPTPESRGAMIWCPADDKEAAIIAGNKPDPDRNMSYSFNANVRPDSSKRNSIALRVVSAPSTKIYIWEEVGPNDAWCADPANSTDDHITGRHGKVDSLQYGSAAYMNAGRGNFCFFDGHTESLTPIQIQNTPTYYYPLK